VVQSLCGSDSVLFNLGGFSIYRQRILNTVWIKESWECRVGHEDDDVGDDNDIAAIVVDNESYQN